MSLYLILASSAVFASDDHALKEDADNAQREITLAGFECGHVNSIKTETSLFSSETTSNVICDNAYHFKILYRSHVRVSVEVVTM